MRRLGLNWGGLALGRSGVRLAMRLRAASEQASGGQPACRKLPGAGFATARTPQAIA